MRRYSARSGNRFARHGVKSNRLSTISHRGGERL